VTSGFLASYLERTGLVEAGPPGLATLRKLHAAHVAAIPFENLDILLGRGISLDLDRLQAKLIQQRRGGYCFEQNTLFLAVLRELGFEATAREARVRAGTAAILPRTHMVLQVGIAGGDWLADVGFGGEGPLEPVPMQGAHPAPAQGLAYRVMAEGDVRVLQMRSGGAWLDQYAILPQPVLPVDFEVANWYTSTHPQSRFVRGLTAQRTTREARYVLRYPTYTEIRQGETVTRDISRGELMPLLREVFLIDLPDDTVFPVVDGAVERALA
jgi:N-hydroxyarylamine O-acetyltransferase